MLGKLEHDKQNGLISIFTDILDSCRKTVLGTYDSTGDELRTGMSLRHMTVDISTLFNAISKDSKIFVSSLNKELNINKNLISCTHAASVPFRYLHDILTSFPFPFIT